MKNVFLTGGAGFIGSHLTARLLAKGCNVTVYDNLSPLSRAKNRIAQFRKEAGFKFILGDVRDRIDTTMAMAGHDTVFHLAANADIPAGVENTDLDLDNNVRGTHNVLEAMRHLGIHSLCFASTAAVYGDLKYDLIERKPLAETEGPLFPISLYGASKLAGEAIVSGYAHMFGIQSSIFRFSNVVGGTMDHGVIYDLIQKLRKNKDEFEVWGDGLGRKPYFLVEDCIEGMLVAYNTSCETSGFIPPCDVYNLGTPTVCSVRRVAEIVREEMDLPNARIKYTGGRHGFNGDVPVVMFDARKMEMFGWRAKHTSEEAVRIACRRLLSE
jgi:UDP-glucose 4-epimerase